MRVRQVWWMMESNSGICRSDADQDCRVPFAENPPTVCMRVAR